jgi:hypothetical protein
MRHTRRVLLVLAGIALVLVTIHFTINGFPSLASLNPHAH